MQAMKSKENSAPMIRHYAQEFLEKHEGRRFRRKELEEYIDSKIEVSDGSKTGALNRLLIDKGFVYGIQRLEWGLYLYDSTTRFDKPSPKNVNEKLISIMDEAFENAKDLIFSIQASDILADNDSQRMGRYKKLLQMKHEIDELLKKQKK